MVFLLPDDVFPFWREHANTAIRTGEPPVTLYQWLNERSERWPIAPRWFRAAASLLADQIVDEVTVPDGVRSLLDLGGGHGLSAATLCERHPDLSAVLFDHPDDLEDDLGEGYDDVLLFNVTHAPDPATVQTLFERADDALASGGRLVVPDQFEGGGRMNAGRAAVAFSTLTDRITLGQSVHVADGVADWLGDAGFSAPSRTGRRRNPGSELLQATRD